ncbi:multidrug resistance efflux transporter family protein [Mesorhizobium sp. M0222]|uniref:multidrug resistance efflux transporter family protein n=1 Tax=Mesorhizobium sp. M0222 TaxID=2956921 RepID=UPI0033358826
MISAQFVNVISTTVFAGIIATGLFYYARNLSGGPRNVTAVDTTQSTEVVFATGNVFVRSVVPGVFQLVGVSLAIFGVAANCFNLEKWIANDTQS